MLFPDNPFRKAKYLALSTLNAVTVSLNCFFETIWSFTSVFSRSYAAFEA
jgi:hypothetical protein